MTAPVRQRQDDYNGTCTYPSLDGSLSGRILLTSPSLLYLPHTLALMVYNVAVSGLAALPREITHAASTEKAHTTSSLVLLALLWDCRLNSDADFL